MEAISGSVQIDALLYVLHLLLWVERDHHVPIQCPVVAKPTDLSERSHALGWLAAWSFRQLHKDTVSGDVGVQRFVGHEAKVLLPIRPGKRGKIVLDSPMGQIELPAETNDAHPFSPGTHVLVAHIDNGVANVTSLHVPVGEQHTESETPRPHGVSQPTK